MYLNAFTRIGFAVFSCLLLSFTNSFAQSQTETILPADIVADKTIGCAPEAVKFSLINAAKASHISWIIANDTITNAEAQQTYLFANAGTYSVAVMYKNALGKDTIITKNNFLSLGSGNNQISLNASRNMLCNIPDTVHFTAFSAKAVSYDWIIDGTNYPNADTQLTHTFRTPGSKDITVRIKDSFGCYTLKTFTKVVTVATPPQVDFTANFTEGCIPLKVNFSQKTVKGSAEIVSWKWDFTGSENISSTAQNPNNITYKKPGSFAVTLTVTTKDGCTYSSTKTGFITAGDTLSPRFSQSKTIVCQGEITTYTSLVKSTGLTWNFPSGTVLPNSTDSIQYVQYNEAGTYSASLKYSNSGCNKVFMVQKAAVVENLKADFTADKFCNCRVADTVAFKNTSSVPSTGKASYFWTFYDQDGKTVLATSTQENPSQIYKTFGSYSVKLVVKHSNGCADSITKTNLLNFEELDVNDFNINPFAGCAGKNLKLKIKASACGDAQYKYEWIVYNAGTSKEVTRLYGETPKVILYTLGGYDVKLIVTSAEGCKVEKFMKNLINIVIPTPAFTADNTAACMEDGITLMEKTTPDSFHYSHNWELVLTSDTTVKIKGSGENFKPVFTRPGVYTVRYTVGVSGGCTYTTEKKNYLKISGIVADFSLSKTEGCLPLSSRLNANILENVHFSSNNTVKYTWSVSPAASVTIADTNAAQTNITITKTGYYTVTLQVTNSIGCKQTITKKNVIYAGIDAAYSMPSKNCFGENVTAKNQSSNNATIFQWSSSSKDVRFLPNANVKNPVLSFTKGGIFNIKLVSRSVEGCSDSVSKNINIEQVTATFSSKDTVNTCAPAYVSFSAKGIGIDSFLWYFGDGEMLRTKDTNIAHVYKHNSGDMSTGYDVMLVAKGKSGCTDTLLRKKYIKVLGPIPAFSVNNTIGCEPLQVSFTNKSKFTEKYYLDFGDFSEPDTVSFGPHTYMVTDSTASYSVVKPRLLAKDAFGCSVWAYVPDSVVVYKAPLAGFSVENKQSCASEPVSFINHSKYAVKFYWDFNSDGKVDDTTRNPKIFLAPGKYAVTLTAENAIGCKDVLFIRNIVTVFDKPEAAISANVDTVCAGGNITFTIAGKDNIAIKSYKWFVNSNAVENYDSASLRKAFSAPGIYAVSAQITTNSGCTNMVKYSGKIVVMDITAPAAPAITYITVEKNAFIKIHWTKSLQTAFGKYKLYKKVNGKFELVYATSDKNITQFEDKQTQVQAQQYSYYLVEENYCGTSSLSSQIHTSVLLKVSAKGKNTLQLNWHTYKGWKQVKEYHIYRADISGFQYINKVNGTDSTYLDNGLCELTYTYYVVAKSAEGNLSSLSNNSFGKPDYLYTATGEDVRFATVTDDDKIYLQWSNNQQQNIKGFIIDRFEPGNGWKNNYATVAEPNFTDVKVNVNDKSYTYRIRTEDQCGNISVAGEIGRSVLLKAQAQDDKVLLKWSSYGRWKNGIRQYRIEILNAQKQWQLVNYVDGNDTVYTDAENRLDIKGALVYRVIAEENAANGATSTSNKAEVFLSSSIYVPNVFTPDNDDVNDVFKAVGRFINEDTGSESHNFKMVIYNRWGEKVFESNSIDKGWDGTFKSQPVQQDTYIYSIIAFGYDKQSYYLNGNVTILR